MTVPDTLITINELTFPAGSARGITISASPINQAMQQSRDMNFNLIDMSHPRSRQYKFTLTCSDMEAPEFATAGVWPGNIVTLTIPAKIVGGDPNGTITRQVMAGEWKNEWDEWGATMNWSIDLEQAEFV